MKQRIKTGIANRDEGGAALAEYTMRVGNNAAKALKSITSAIGSREVS
jgi:hypothetical protein